MVEWQWGENNGIAACHSPCFQPQEVETEWGTKWHWLCTTSLCIAHALSLQWYSKALVRTFLGDLKRNATVIGLAIKHCGLRPSLAMFEQAAHQFFALALPRGKDFCSNPKAIRDMIWDDGKNVKHVCFWYEVHVQSYMQRLLWEWCMPSAALLSALLALGASVNI